MEILNILVTFDPSGVHMMKWQLPSRRDKSFHRHKNLLIKTTLRRLQRDTKGREEKKGGAMQIDDGFFTSLAVIFSLLAELRKNSLMVRFHLLTVPYEGSKPYGSKISMFTVITSQ